jgi:hypothetical protein
MRKPVITTALGALILAAALASCPDPGGGGSSERSSNATLKDLTISRGTLYPPFAPQTAAYSVTVTNAVEHITLSAEPNHEGALVAGAGDHPLSVGPNPLALTVTAEDGSAGTYTVTVTRAEPHEGPDPLEEELVWTTASQTVFSYETGELISAVAWGAGKFVAVGQNGKMAWSPDGLAWTAVADSGFGTSNITCIAWNGARFVAGGGQGKMAYSADGLTWTPIPGGTGPGTSQFVKNGVLAIAWNGERFVAGGVGNIAWSDDGLAWTLVPSGTGPGTSQFTSAIWSIAWGGGRFVAGGTSGQMAWSADGLTWNPITFNNPDLEAQWGFQIPYFQQRIYGLAWGGGRFAAVDYNGKMAWSADGVTWNPVAESPFGFNPINAVAWGNNQFIAVGLGAIAVSPNGETWTLAPGAPGLDYHGIAWGDGIFVVSGKAALVRYGAEE